jgi:hypothetical protein
MPPKSTWFEPKLRDGLLVHLIKWLNKEINFIWTIFFAAVYWC